jgi:hypothetical protein
MVLQTNHGAKTAAVAQEIETSTSRNGRSAHQNTIDCNEEGKLKRVRLRH